jgi:hypothetical protein
MNLTSEPKRPGRITCGVAAALITFMSVGGSTGTAHAHSSGPEATRAHKLAHLRQGGGARLFHRPDPEHLRGPRLLLGADDHAAAMTYVLRLELDPLRP